MSLNIRRVVPAMTIRAAPRCLIDETVKDVLSQRPGALSA